MSAHSARFSVFAGGEQVAATSVRRRRRRAQVDGFRYSSRIFCFERSESIIKHRRFPDLPPVRLLFERNSVRASFCVRDFRP